MTSGLIVVAFLISIAAGYFIQPACARSWHWLMEPNLVDKWQAEVAEKERAAEAPRKYAAKQQSLDTSIAGLLRNSVSASRVIQETVDGIAATVDNTIGGLVTAIEYGVGDTVHRKIRGLEKTIQAIALGPPDQHNTGPNNLRALYADGYKRLTAETTLLAERLKHTGGQEYWRLTKELHELQRHLDEYRAKYEHVLTSTP